ncbi:hypothetical protein PG987_006240 [Apiospora arundinis]
MPQGDHHPPRRSTTRGFEVLALERIERRETRKACVYRHQASISFLFALAAQVQALASLIWVSVHRHYPVPIEVFLGCNIVYVVLFFVYIPFWLSSRYHALIFPPGPLAAALRVCRPPSSRCPWRRWWRR